MDYRDYALEVVYDQGYPAEGMLIAALKYMSQDDVKDMLRANDLLPEEDEEPDVDYLTELYDAFGEEC